MPLTGPGTNSFPGNGVIIIDETPIVGGTDGYVLYDNNGVVGVEPGGGGGGLTIGTTTIAGGTANYALTVDPTGLLLDEAQIRTILTGNLNLYVNAATGSDSYNGLSATFTGGVNGPWATGQHADNVIATTLDKAGFTVNVHVAAGNYVGVDFSCGVGGGVVQWIGAGPGVTFIQSDAGGGSSFSSIGVLDSAIAIDNLTIQPTLADVNDAASVAMLGAGNTLYLGTLANGATSGLEIDITHSPGGFWLDDSHLFVLPGPITISGGVTPGPGSPGYIFYLSSNASIYDSGNWTDNGINDYSIAFLYLVAGTYESVSATYAVTGTPTGKRFSLANSSAAYNYGSLLGLNFFPGSIAGTTDGGSSYDGFSLEPQRSIGSSGDLPIIWSDDVLNIGLSAPLAITIPAASTRSGRALLLQDPTGSWATHNPTFNRTGSDTFDGLTSLVGKISYGWIQLRPMFDGVNSGYKIQGGIWQ